MRKIHFTSILVLLLLFAFSCSKDKDTPPDVEQIPPSDFLLTVEASFTVATATWTVGEGENNENLLYSIYVNDALIANSILETSFLFENLQTATSFTLKVVAKNESGETPVSINFQTLNTEDYKVLISKFTYPYSEDFVSTFTYYDNKIQTFFDGDVYSDTYYYDVGGNLIQQKTNCCLFQFVTTDLTYENNELNGIVITHNNDLSWVKNTYEFEINSFDEYTVSNIAEEYDGTPISVQNYDIQLVHDTENRIANYLKTNLDTLEEVELSFEYENGNLVKITDVTNNNVVDILYDTMNNFRHYNHYNSRLTSNYLFFRYSNDLISNELLFIPEFTFFNNKNNPIQYLENGVSVKRFEYEYNEFNYPISIINPNTSQEIQGFEYLIVEQD